MEISNDILLEGLFIYLKKYDTLVISDPHIGFEDELHSRGIILPKNGLKELKATITSSLNRLNRNNNSVKKIIINGDLVHSFARLSLGEKDALKDFMKFIKNFGEVIILLGNHDKTTKYLLKDISLHHNIILGDVQITHGDRIDSASTQEGLKTIIIGHEHPAIILSDGLKKEKFKCFLEGKYQDKCLIVMPSANLLVEGTNVLSEKLQSPYIENISHFKAYLVADKIYDFGTISEIHKSHK